jgi:probable rRNA maturation factor
LECEEAELSLLITEDSEIAELNKQYRKKDKATDVLSFPMQKIKSGKKVVSGLLGDVVISAETTISQAKEYETTVPEEFLRLLIHGTLHLLGYDHENVTKAEAEKMVRKELQLYKKIVNSL